MHCVCSIGLRERSFGEVDHGREETGRGAVPRAWCTRATRYGYKRWSHESTSPDRRMQRENAAEAAAAAISRQTVLRQPTRRRFQGAACETGLYRTVESKRRSLINKIIACLTCVVVMCGGGEGDGGESTRMVTPRGHRMRGS